MFRQAGAGVKVDASCIASLVAAGGGIVVTTVMQRSPTLQCEPWRRTPWACQTRDVWCFLYDRSQTQGPLTDAGYATHGASSVNEPSLLHAILKLCRGPCRLQIKQDELAMDER